MNRIKSTTIKLSKNDLKKAEEFAKARENHDVSMYKYRGAFKTVDLICGALGELAAYKLINANLNVTPPDFSIHEVRNKNFEPDLSGPNGERFHIKCQTMESVNRYGASWLMQRSDSVINSPKDNDFMVPCVVDLEALEVTIFGVIRYRDIIDSDLIGECKVDWLKRTKRAIYLDDLKELSVNKRWCLDIDIT